MTAERRSERDGNRVEVDGRDGVRFVRELAHPPERVWRAITDPKETASWLPASIEGDLNTAGSELRFVSPEYDSPEPGKVIESERPRLLAYAWGETTIRIELDPAGEGTRLTFTHLLPRDDTARVAAGWELCFDSLRQLLNGEAIGEFDPQRYLRLHDRYAEDFGVDPAIGRRGLDERRSPGRPTT